MGGLICIGCLGFGLLGNACAVHRFIFYGCRIVHRTFPVFSMDTVRNRSRWGNFYADYF